MKNAVRAGLVVCLLGGAVVVALVAERFGRTPPAVRLASAPTLAPATRPSATPPPPAQRAAPLATRAKGANPEPREEALAVAALSIPGIAGGVVGGVVGGVPTQAPPGPRLGLRAGEAAMDRERADFDTEAYEPIRDNPFLPAATNPLSTFSIDVDTASYANVRRFLARGQLPPKDAVRIEELLNYFRYDYPEPRAEDPFSVTTEVAACPWTPAHRLVLVGLRGRSGDAAHVPPRRLTFLLDVSGSMDAPNKLPLLKEAMALLVESLREQDRLAIVVYAGSSGLVLPPDLRGPQGGDPRRPRLARGGRVHRGRGRH